MDKWRILVVDDEEDVHAVTGLALKRRVLRGKPFELVSAHSCEEAKKLVDLVGPFHVALVDVVMETDHAGLDFCDYVRNTQPRWTRIILRTGQPGVAPEETVLNEYDIDYYLAKSEVTQERLFATVRACLRSSQDMKTLMNVGDQLQEYVRVVQEDDSLDQLLQSYEDTLKFLEQKYDVGMALIAELVQGYPAERMGPAFKKMAQDGTVKLEELRSTARARGAATGQKPQVVGNNVIVPIEFAPPNDSESRKGALDTLYGFLGGARGVTAAGSVVIAFPTKPSDRAVAQIAYDVRLFSQNWKLAYQLLCSQKAISDAASGVVW